ncbi:hypothetical protein GX408_17650 [bacterium]|nr:hypothetical protein [bacterium]
MKKWMGFALVLVMAAAEWTPAQLQSESDYRRNFALRRKAFFTVYDTMRTVNYNSIAARYRTGKNLAWADSAFIELLKNPSGDMFWMFPCIGTYLAGKGKMSAPAAAAVRRAWKTYAPARGDTENHWAMYYATLYLAAEQWPDLPGSEWYNGKSSEENRLESREYLFSWARLTATRGQGEFDSPDYLAEYMIASTLLSGYAKDAQVKQLGTMLADYFMADFAVEHLHQQYGGGHSRIYEVNLMRFDRSTSSGFAYLYFGAGDPITSGWCYYPLQSGYALPYMIYQMAMDRSTPYVHRERKRVRNNIRFGKELNPPVYKYTYMNREYVLGSLHGSLLQPIQQQTWCLRYLYGKPFSMIFGLHPYWSIEEIGTFFPEEIKPSMAGIIASKATYNNPDKWTGGSYYEYTFQDKNTLLVLYDIPAGTTSNHIDGFFPANLQERRIDPSGWILCKAGDVYAGWYPLQPAEWSEEYELRTLVWNLGTGSARNDGTMDLRNHRLRSWPLQNGYVIQVGSLSENGSFDAFCRAVAETKPVAVLQPGRVSVDYRTWDGRRMEFAYPDQRKLNGQKVAYEQFKLFDGPFLQAEVDSEMLTMRYGGKTRIYNFKTMTIQ